MAESLDDLRIVADLRDHVEKPRMDRRGFSAVSIITVPG
jgi:hypothetical protein